MIEFVHVNFWAWVPHHVHTHTLSTQVSGCRVHVMPALCKNPLRWCDYGSWSHGCCYFAILFCKRGARHVVWISHVNHTNQQWCVSHQNRGPWILSFHRLNTRVFHLLRLLDINELIRRMWYVCGSVCLTQPPFFLCIAHPFQQPWAEAQLASSLFDWFVRSNYLQDLKEQCQDAQSLLQVEYLSSTYMIFVVTI